MNVIDRHAVARGAALGLLLFVPLSTIFVVIDHNVDDFDHSGWATVLAILLLLVYMFCGFVAGRLAPDAPFSNGMVAAMGAFLLWIPIRIIIWAVRVGNKGLFTGHQPVFSVSTVFGQFVVAAGLGAIGGWLATRRPAPVTSADSD
ncbi:MAG: hypothetical protein ACXVJZ_16400 [Acidimicrobiia bacterium]